MIDREIDLDHLLSMTGQDPELAEEVLEIFREQSGMWARMLDPKLAPQEWADAAHTIKGSALSVGAKELARVCLKAETLGRSGDVSRVQAAVALSDVKSELSFALEAVARASHALSKPGLRASNEANS